jgi:Rieske 2Fe-2S family protein
MEILAMDATARLAPIQASHTLPACHYTDPATFGREIERFFAARWLAVGRDEEVAGPGDYFVRTVAGESVVILRDDQGEIRSFFNVCRHRGTRICTGAEGRFAGTIQCPYHAWTYDLAGRLIGAPHMEGTPGFDKGDYPLKEIPLEVWEGHIFLNLDPGEGAATLASQLGEVPGRFRPWRMGELRRAARIVYDVAANWKLIIQNYSECLHCPIIHPALQKLSHYLSGVNDPPQDGALGGWMLLREGVETLTIDGRRRRACLPGLGPEECGRVYYYAILPNLLLSLHPDYVMTHILWPRACDRTEIVCEWHFHPDEIVRPGFDPSDAVEFWDLTNRQDWHVCELSQLGLNSRAYTPGPYSVREGILYDFDRLVARVVAAAEAKETRRPDSTGGGAPVRAE